MDKKRLLILGIFILFTVLLGYLMYRVFFAPAKKTTTTKPVGTNAQNNGQLPTAGPGGIKTSTSTKPAGLPTSATSKTSTTATTQKTPLITQVVKNAIKNPQVDNLGRVSFYNEQDGKFYRLKKDGTTELMSDEVFHSVNNITWSPDSAEAILEYPDGANIYYNFSTKKQTTLPKHWQEFSFSPAGDKIGAKSITVAPENRWLITSDPDGANIRSIEPMGANADKVTVDWSPNQEILGFSLTGQALGADRQEVLLVGFNGENLPSLTVEGRGFQSQWSPTGKHLVYSVYSERSDYKPELWVVGAEGNDIGANRKLLSVNTWADKCTFSDERFVYCAVPSSMPTGAAFAPRVTDNIADNLYRLDTQSGARTPIQMNENHTISSIFLNEDKTKLYFTDKNQTGLFEVKL